MEPSACIINTSLVSLVATLDALYDMLYSRYCTYIDAGKRQGAFIVNVSIIGTAPAFLVRGTKHSLLIQRKSTSKSAYTRLLVTLQTGGSVLLALEADTFGEIICHRSISGGLDTRNSKDQQLLEIISDIAHACRNDISAFANVGAT